MLPSALVLSAHHQAVKLGAREAWLCPQNRHCRGRWVKDRSWIIAQSRLNTTSEVPSLAEELEESPTWTDEALPIQEQPGGGLWCGCFSVRKISKRFPAVSWRGNLSSSPAAGAECTVYAEAARLLGAEHCRPLCSAHRGGVTVSQSSCETGVDVDFPLIAPSAFILNSPHRSPALLLPLPHPRWTWSSKSIHRFLELLHLLSLFPRSP